MTDTTQAAGLTDEQIEATFKKHGGKWDGDRWTIEDADLHPFFRAALAAQAVPADTQRCIDARNKLNEAIHGPGAVIDSLEHAVAYACERLKAQAVPAANQRHLPLAVQSMGEWKTVRYPASPAPAEAKEEPKQNGLTKAETEAPASVFGLIGHKGLEPKYEPFAKIRTTPQPQAAQPVADIGALMSLVGQYWDIAHAEGETGQSMGDKAQRVLDRIRSAATKLYTAAPALTEEQEREAFEEWAESEDFDLSVNWGNQQYTDGATLLAWDAWKARAALRSTQGGE